MSIFFSKAEGQWRAVVQVSISPPQGPEGMGRHTEGTFASSLY